MEDPHARDSVTKPHVPEQNKVITKNRAAALKEVTDVLTSDQLQAGQARAREIWEQVVLPARARAKEEIERRALEVHAYLEETRRKIEKMNNELKSEREAQRKERDATEEQT